MSHTYNYIFACGPFEEEIKFCYAYLINGMRFQVNIWNYSGCHSLDSNLVKIIKKGYYRQKGKLGKYKLEQGKQISAHTKNTVNCFLVQ
jgi:hypothetical protein